MPVNPNKKNLRSVKNEEKIKRILRDNIKVADNILGFTSQLYAYLSVRVQIGKDFIVVPVSHLVWFLNTGEWVKDGLELDHIDDNPLNNSFNNLSEVTRKVNNYKKRGRGDNSRYGTGKYGFGLGISYTSERNIYKVYQIYPTRNTERKQEKEWIGRFKTKEEAEEFIKEYSKTLVNINPLDILEED